MIDDSRLWGSSPWRRMGEYSTETRLFTQVVHNFDNYESALSEGGALAVVVPGFPPTPHQTRDNTEFLRLMGQNEARRRTAREGEMVVGATPGFWPLMRHGAGAGYSGLYSSFSLPLGVAPTTIIPGGKAIERCRGQGRSSDRSGPRLPPAR